MRIGIEVQRIFRLNKHGMEIAAGELINEIQKQDKENEYVLFAKKGADENYIQQTSNFKINSFSTVSYAHWEQITLPKVIKQEKIDFLHATCNTAPINCPVPLMLTVHDIIYLENLDFKGSAYQNFGNIYRRFVVPRAAEKSRIIITVSEYEKKVITDRLNIPGEKVKVIYNGVNKKFFHRNSKDEINNFKKKYQLPEEFFLFLGNRAPKKNTRNVILAFLDYCKRTRDPIPMVILDYQKIFLEELLYRLDKHSAIRFFVFPGYIPGDEMPLMYQAASVFLYPSLRESFGMPIIEAMACGTPVITSNTSSMPEVAGDAAMLVDPYSSFSIADAMEKLRMDPALMTELKEKGFERAKQFSWEKAAAELLTTYKKLL